jgi:hypothetical protein
MRSKNSGAPRIFISGTGSVSPAGWSAADLWACVSSGNPAPDTELERPGWEHPLRARRVPRLNPRPSFLNHPRLRRASPISQFAMAAAIEAMGPAYPLSGGRVGVILCVMSGCVNYSRRFYDEAWRDPATASPLVFPETVFNAPASHIAALLGTGAINYTLVGDPGTFLQGLALAAQWLLEEQVEGCVVIGAEEIDWITSDAFRHFQRDAILAEGAGALYLTGSGGGENSIELRAITDSHLFLGNVSRARAVLRMREELPPGSERDWLVESSISGSSADAAERKAWQNWPGSRLAPKQLLGEALAAGSAWQCVAAVEALKQQGSASAFVSVAGCNQQAIGAQFATRS